MRLVPAPAVRYFNPHPSTRGDRAEPDGPRCCCSFQSTPLNEGRPKIERGGMVQEIISIHTPQRGATIIRMNRF